jgi:ribonuclease D
MFQQETQYIDNDAAMQQLCNTLLSKQVIALDTEFIRVRTFYPKPGLFQINDGDTIYLLDPLAVTQWDEFKNILSSKDIVKVFHACDEDIELLYHFLAIKPEAVFDTQVAAALCGYDYSMGYQRLLQQMLEVDVEKGASRTDWLQRPLSPVQLHYAADDVRYLLEVHRRLSVELDSRGFADVVAEEYEAVFANISNEDYSTAYKRVKQAKKLKAPEFMLLEVLACWREEAMRRLDLPRNKIASNDALLSLAKLKQFDAVKLQRIEGLPASTLRLEFAAIEQLFSQQQALAAAGDLRRLPRMNADLLQKLKLQLQVVATSVDVAEHMLSRKAFNEALAEHLRSNAVGFELTDWVQGWRLPFYQQALKSLGYAV